MTEIPVEEQLRTIESLMFVLEGHDWEGSDNPVISVLLEQEPGQGQGVLLRKDCPGAARDRINLAQETTKINEKKLRIDQEAYKIQFDVAKKRGDTRSAEFLQGKLKEITDARRRNLENMDKLESIASDYAVKHKPGNDKLEQRSHAIFLQKHMSKMQERLSKEEAADFPNPDTIEKLQRRMERVGTAQAESEKWLQDNDGLWNKAFKEGSVGADDIKAAVKAKREELQAKISGEADATGAASAPKPETGATGAAAATEPKPAPTTAAPKPAPTTAAPKPAPTTAAPKPESGTTDTAPEKEKKGPQRNPRLRAAMSAAPGSTWESEGGFGAKNMSGAEGDGKKGVKYFPTASEAEGYAKNTGSPEGSRRTNATGRKPVEKKPMPSAEKPKRKPKTTTKTTTPELKRDKDIAARAIKLTSEKKPMPSAEKPKRKPKKPKTTTTTPELRRDKDIAARAIKLTSEKKPIMAGDLVQNIVGKYLHETYRKSGLGKWFSQSADDTPGWDRYNSKGERAGKCGDAAEGDPYAACLSPEKAEKLGKEGIASFVRRKRAAQRKAGMGKKGQGEAGGGEEPVRVSTGVDKVDEEWSQEYKDSIDCQNPKGFSQRAHCKGKEKNMNESKKWKGSEAEARLKKAKSDYESHAAEIRKPVPPDRRSNHPMARQDIKSGKMYWADWAEGKEVSTDELKSAAQELIALIKKHERLAYEAKKAGNTKEYNKQRGIVAEFSAEIKTVQDIIKRTLKSGKTTVTITEEDGEEKPLNKPFRTPGENKKFAVYVRNDNGNVVKVRFGDPNMEIRRDNPARLKAFRSRHSCDDDVGPKWKARYWSCQMWRSDKSVDDILAEAAENEPTNPELWEKVQDLVAGRASSMQHGGETIEGPNDGKGFDVHPSAYSNAWAAKLYKRLGGGWRAVPVKEDRLLERTFAATSIMTGRRHRGRGGRPLTPEERAKQKAIQDQEAKLRAELKADREAKAAAAAAQRERDKTALARQKEIEARRARKKADGPVVGIDDQAPGSIVRTRNGFRAKNKEGNIRYFDDEKEAKMWLHAGAAGVQKLMSDREAATAAFHSRSMREEVSSKESIKEFVRSVISKTLSESAEQSIKKKLVYDLEGKSEEEIKAFLDKQGIEYIKEDGILYVFSDDDEPDTEPLTEAAAKRKVVIRKGQRKIIFKCPPGKKKVGARTCIVRKASERMKLSRKAIRSARKSRSKRARANRLRKRSNVKRAAMGLNKRRR